MKLYHYCSNSAFINIVESKKLWLSELSLSNDYMEGVWVREALEKYLADQGVDNHEIAQILMRFDEYSILISAAAFCLSEEPDLLNQWRGYADDGAGVSIGFTKEYLERLCSLQPDSQ